MASQPANTDISVARRIRSQKNHLRHTSVKHLVAPFDDSVMVVPGEEILVFENRDATFKTGQFRFGFPVLVLPRTLGTLAAAVAGIANLAFPVRLVGNVRDVFLEKTAGNLTDDLHQNLRDISPAPRGLFAVV